MLTKIFNTGVSNAKWNTLLKKKYILTNTVCFLLALSTFPFIFVFYSSGWFFSATTLVFFLIFASGIYLNKLGALNVSRNLVLGAWSLGVFVYSLFLSSETGLQYCFFSLIAAPFIMFTPKEENQRYLHLISPIFLYFMVDLEVLSPYFPKVISSDTAYIISNFVKPTVLIQIVLILYYYSSQENDLLSEVDSNKKLNNSLRSNSEELLEFSARLKRSESSLNSLLNSIDDVVVEVNKDGKVLNFWTTSNIEIEIGSYINENFGNFMKIKILAAFNQFKGDYFNKIHEYNYEGKDYQFKITPVDHIDSNEESAVVAIRDITMNKRIADEYNEVKKEKEVAVRSAEFKESFLANISHEIRTPLNGVVGMIDLLKDTSLDNTQEDYVETLKSSSENLLVLINDVLDLSKIQAGKMEINNTDGDFHMLLNKVSELFQPMAKLKGIELMVEIDNSVPQFLKFDTTRLNQVLTNLVSNAVKFTASGSVKLRVRKTTEGVKFEVQDTGEGIPVEAQKSIFSQFTQLENKATHIKGTGLGLSIVSQLVKLMGGEIKVYSEKGNGACFYFTLNLKKVGSISNSTSGNKESFNFNGKSVLLVDDIRVNRKVASIMLKKMGANVVEVENGAEALDVFDQANFDLILMDIQMPVMGGEESMEKIKAAGFDRPIVALSANALEGDEEKYLKQGFDGYISKPITLSKLESGLMKIPVLSS